MKMLAAYVYTADVRYPAMHACRGSIPIVTLHGVLHAYTRLLACLY